MSASKQRAIAYYQDLFKKNPDRDQAAMREGIKYFHREGNQTQFLPRADELEHAGRRRMALSAEQAKPEETSGDFMTGLKRGVQTTQAMGYGGAALAGRAMKGIGMDDAGQSVMDFGIKGYQRNIKEAEKYPAKHSFKDVYTGKAGFGGAIDWAQGTLGELAPTMAQAALGSLLGTVAAPGAGTAAGAFASRTVLKKSIDKMAKEMIESGAKGLTEKEIRKQATKQALMKAGGLAGMGAAVFPLEAGGMYAGLLDEHGVDAPGTALLFGTLATAMEYAGGNSRLVDGFVDAIAKGSQGRIKKTAKELLTNIPEEALQEAGQELMQVLNTVVNTDEKLLTQEHIEQIVEAAGAGAVGGGAGAVASGILSRSGNKDTDKSLDDKDKKVSDAEKVLLDEEDQGKSPEDLLMGDDEDRAATEFDDAQLDAAMGAKPPAEAQDPAQDLAQDPIHVIDPEQTDPMPLEGSAETGQADDMGQGLSQTGQALSQEEQTAEDTQGADQQPEPTQIADKEPDQFSKLDDTQRSFVEKKVQEAGSIDAVDKAYDTDSVVDQFARFKAREVFGDNAKTEPEPEEIPKNSVRSKKLSDVTPTETEPSLEPGTRVTFRTKKGEVEGEVIRKIKEKNRYLVKKEDGGRSLVAEKDIMGRANDQAVESETPAEQAAEEAPGEKDQTKAEKLAAIDKFFGSDNQSAVKKKLADLEKLKEEHQDDPGFVKEIDAAITNFKAGLTEDQAPAKEDQADDKKTITPEQQSIVDRVDKAINQRARGNVFAELGRDAVPGLRMQEHEEAGQWVYQVAKGEATQEEFDAQIEEWRKENRIREPEQTPAAEPEGFTHEEINQRASNAYLEALKRDGKMEVSEAEDLAQKIERDTGTKVYYDDDFIYLNDPKAKETTQEIPEGTPVKYRTKKGEAEGTMIGPDEKRPNLYHIQKPDGKTTIVSSKNLIGQVEDAEETAETHDGKDIEIEGDTVSVEMPASEEKTLKPAEQKKYLMDEIDAAIKEAPDRDTSDAGKGPHESPRDAFDRNKDSFGYITIEVPGDGEYNVLNTKAALEKFKKRAARFPAKEFEHKEPLPKPAGTRKINTRITGFAGEYQTDYTPRRSTKTPDPIGGKFYRKDGWFSNGAALVKADPKNIGKQFPIEEIPENGLERMIADGKPTNNPVTSITEVYKNPDATEESQTLDAVVYSDSAPEGQNAAVFDPRQLDFLFRFYPDAEASIKFGKNHMGEYGILFLKDKGEVVGVLQSKFTRQSQDKVIRQVLESKAKSPKQADSDPVADRLKKAKQELPAGYSIQRERGSDGKPVFSLMQDGRYVVNGLGHTVAGIDEAVRQAKAREKKAEDSTRTETPEGWKRVPGGGIVSKFGDSKYLISGGPGEYTLTNEENGQVIGGTYTNLETAANKGNQHWIESQRKKETPAPKTKKPSSPVDFIYEHFKSGKGFKNITEARKVIGEATGKEFKPGTVEAKQLDETIEVAAVRVAREIVAEGKPPQETFDTLVDLQDRMPNLSVRTSTSMQNQAYSTPLPLAYLASLRAGINDKTSVFEPAAGNGALLIGANPKKVIANEIDPARVLNLEHQGFAKVMQEDGSALPVTMLDDRVDVVVGNPPFGTVKDDSGNSRRWMITHRYETTQIDHAMVFSALEQMKPDGRAVFIIGSVKDQNTEERARKNLYRTPAKVNFFKHLFDNYNVVDLFSVSGKLYSKQGASWPVDVIVIDGAGKSAMTLPGAKPPPYISTLEQLKEKLNDNRNDSLDADGTRGSGDSTVPAGDTVSQGDGDKAGGTGIQKLVAAGDQGTAETVRQPGSSDGTPGVKTGEPGAAAGGRGPGQRGTDAGSVDKHPDQRPAGGVGDNRPGAQQDTDGDGQKSGTADQKPGQQHLGGQSPVSIEQELANTSEAELDALLDDAFGEDITVPQDISEELQSMSEEQIDNLIDEVFDSPSKTETPAKTPIPDEKPDRGRRSTDVGLQASRARNEEAIERYLKNWARREARKNKPPKKPPKDTKDHLEDIALESLEGVKDAVKGLSALFTPRNTLSSGFVFNEDTYNAAKPYFVSAWEHAKKAGHSLKQLIQHLSTQFGAEIKPYLKRFFMEQTEAEKAEKNKDKKSSKKKEEKADPDTQVPYNPASKSPPIGTLMPKNMGDAIKKALDRVQEKHGDIDQYVADQLGYTVEEVTGKDGEFGYFSAEQVDAIALAIDNIGNGSGFIIGDQTGVGKGRVVAAMIRYAMHNDLTPVFVTHKPYLYADMYRDLSDIGMADISDRILMTNSNETIPMTEDGSVVLKTKSNHVQNLRQMTREGEVSKDYDVVFTTYDQMNDTGSARRVFLETITRGRGMIIMDEAHNAGGTAGDRVDPRTGKVPRSIWFRDLIQNCHSTFYSSATYAKRPDTMSLYSRTDMRLAVDDINDLAHAIGQGGVPLQQVTATMLAEAGQYIRRERSFEGVTYDTQTVEVDQKKAADMSVAFAEIKKFSDEYISGAIEDLGDTGAAGGWGVSGSSAASDRHISTTGFTSVMHNLISQTLLALKVPAAVDMAIKQHKETGRKPVIALANTMGSFIEEHALENNLKPGDGIGLTFNHLINNYLDKTRRYKETVGNQKIDRYVTDEELGPEGVKEFNRIKDMINALDFTGVPISPVDYALSKFRDAGIKAGEITGREHTIEYRPDGTQTYQRRGAKEKSNKAKVDLMKDFNFDKVNALILNQSGSTGLSIHALPKWEGHDPAERVMVLVQTEANIDTHMQMLGRVHRAGQVKAPTYIQLTGNIPTEMRPAAVLSGKMASLNANTTAAKSGKLEAANVVDFINKYGDKVVANLMGDFPEIHEALGTPLSQDNNSASGLKEQGAARKVTGRIPLLRTIKEQQQLYDMIVSEYNDQIDQLDATGQNDLEAKTFDTDARTLSRAIVFDGRGAGQSPFTSPAMAEVVDMKKIGRSYTGKEVVNLLKQNILGMDSATAKREDRTIDELMVDVEMQQEVRRRDSMEAFTVFLNEQLEDIENEDRRNATRVRLTTVAQHWQNIYETAVPGTVWEFPLGDTYYPMVVLNVQQKGAPKNPLALGTWRVTFAVPDSARRFEMSFAAINGLLKTENDLLRQNRGPATEADLARFDRARSTAREDRTIMTGNLLAAYARYPRGRIINFTDTQGKIRQGILMPLNFNTQEAFNEQRIVLNDADRILSVLEEGIWVKSRRGDLMVGNVLRGGGVRDRDTFSLSVPASRAKGGTYFLNQGLLDAIGGEFVKRSNRMVATVPKSRIRRVFQYMLNSMNELFENASDNQRVRNLLGIGDLEVEQVSQQGEKTQSQPQFQTTADYTPGQGLTLKDIQSRFKGQQVFLSLDGSVSIRMKNGMGLVVRMVNFGGKDKAMAMQLGRMDEKGAVLGKYENLEIQLNRDLADTISRDHELYHFLAENLLNKGDRQVIKGMANAYKRDGKFQFEWRSSMEENEANAFAQFLSEREQHRNTALGRVLQKIIDFFDGLLHIGRMSQRKLAREVESGKVFERESSGEMGADAKYHRLNADPWPADFPNATLHTSLSKMRKHPAYKKAKSGDIAAAIQVVSDVVKPEKIRALYKQYPDAIVLAPHAEEAAGRNKIPLALAALMHQYGFQVGLGIAQTNTASRTKKDSVLRLVVRPEFDGPVVDGGKYILIDDAIGQGGTLSELRYFIESNGGKVVHISALTAGIFGAKVPITAGTIQKIESKFGRKQTEEFLYEHNTAGSLEALTEKEGRTILGFPSLDVLRDRVASAGSEAGIRIRTEAPPADQEVTPSRKTPSPKHTFAGPEATGADKSLAFEAQQMRDAGQTRLKIWKETGWWEIVPGSDVWAWEIDDSMATVDTDALQSLPGRLDLATQYLRDKGLISQKQDIGSPKATEPLRLKALEWADKQIKAGKAPSLPLDQVLNHPDLLDNYPFLKDIKVTRAASPEYAGVFDPDTKTISVTGFVGQDPKGTFLHEAQHAIQDYEGFATGGNLSSFDRDNTLIPIRKSPEIQKIYKEADRLQEQGDTQGALKLYEKADKKAKLLGYSRLTGEVQARLTERRKALKGDKTRKAEPPWITMKYMMWEEGLIPDLETKPEDVLISRYDKEPAFSTTSDRKTKINPRTQKKGFLSDRYKDDLPPEVAARMEKGKGVDNVSLITRLKNLAKDMSKERSHFPELSRMEDKTKQASARETLRRHQEIPASSQDRAAREITDIVRELTEEEYNDFSLELILGDEVRAINDGQRTNDNLPFGFQSTDDVIRSFKKIQARNKKNDRVSEALTKRRKLQKSLAKDLVRHGIMKKEILRDGDYFHHQVLMFWNDKAEEKFRGLGTSSQEVRTKWRPWMAARKGSPLDYNTQYMEAEIAVVAQQIAQVETAKNLAQLQRENDVLKQLKSEAKAANQAAYDRWVEAQTAENMAFEDPIKPHRQKIAMGFSGLAKAVKTGNITYDSEFEDVVRAIQNMDAADMEINHPRIFPFLSHLLDKEHKGAMFAAMVYKGIKGRNDVMKSVLGKNLKTWKSFIPEGYREWKPDPNAGWFWTNSIADEALQKIMTGEADLNDVTIRQVLARGNPTVWVIPEGLADTMDHFRPFTSEGRLGRLSETAMSAWKQYILINPLSVLRYNINNTSGDLDVVLAYRPEIAAPKRMTQAVKDLWDWTRFKKIDKDLKAELDEAQKHGVIGSGFAVQEVADTLKMMSMNDFVRDVLREEKPNIAARWWKHSKDLTRIRENTLRLCAFRWFKSQIESGKRNLYGASKRREDIDNLISQGKTTEAAAKLSRELLGDYGNISRHGEYLRKHLIPFWSWQEINLPRYVYMMRNLRHEGETTNRLGLIMAKRSAVFAAKASMLAGAVILYNMTMFPDEWDELGEAKRRQLHLICGRRDDGSIISIRFQGALSDALSWFGKEDLPADLKDMAQGKSTIQEQTADAGKAVVNRLVSGMRPDMKTLFETLTGKTTWPDAFSPRPVRDKVENILQTFKLDMPYRYLMGRPGRGDNVAEHLISDLAQLLTYTTEPGVQAYYDTRKAVFDWKDKHGLESGGGTPTKKGNALYYYRQALKYGDLPAAEKYLQKYYDLGGTPPGVQQSIRMAHPLAGIKKTQRYQFRQELSPKEQKRLDLALKWYQSTYVQRGQ